MDGNGLFAGYVPTDAIRVRDAATAKRITAQTLVDVTDAQGAVVGYWAYAYGFVPRAVASAPGFDIEDLRAQRNGGCEPVIGDGSSKMEYPTCPVPPEPTTPG